MSQIYKVSNCGTQFTHDQAVKFAKQVSTKVLNTPVIVEACFGVEEPVYIFYNGLRYCYDKTQNAYE